MVTLSCTLDTFSEEIWQKVFQAYVKVNKSHWVGAPFDVVKKQLEMKGVYEFFVPAMGTWTSKFRLELQENGHLEVEFVKNLEIKGRMQVRLNEMTELFAEDVRHLC